jgi:uncharacterized protein (TIGR02118 family)
LYTARGTKCQEVPRRVITRFWLAPRRRDLSIEASQAHWRSVHREIGKTLPGVLRYVQNHGIVRNGQYLLPYPGFDICAELTWHDEPAMEAALAAPRHAEDAVEDERNFVQPELARVCVTERHVRIACSGPVKLMTFLRRRPGVTVAQLTRALGGHEHFIGRGAFDAIDVLWFATEADAVEYLRSPLYTEATSSIDPITEGSVRFLVRPEVVLE